MLYNAVGITKTLDSETVLTVSTVFISAGLHYFFQCTASIMFPAAHRIFEFTDNCESIICFVISYQGSPDGILITMKRKI